MSARQCVRACDCAQGIFKALPYLAIMSRLAQRSMRFFINNSFCLVLFLLLCGFSFRFGFVAKPCWLAGRLAGSWLVAQRLFHVQNRSEPLWWSADHIWRWPRVRGKLFVTLMWT